MIIINSPETFVILMGSLNNNFPAITVKTKLIAVNTGVTRESDPIDNAFDIINAATKTKAKARITLTSIKNGI